MSTKYFALLTQLGADKLANAAALGTKIEITHMAIGDGGGSLPTPDTKQTKLINEQRRAAINTLSIDPKNTNQIIAEQVIPEAEGGWWIREIGLYDKDGVLIAVGNCAETYKPQLQEGSGRTQTIRMILIVSSANAVTLKVDPSVVLATREYVDDLANAANNNANTRLEKNKNGADIPDKKVFVENLGLVEKEILSSNHGSSLIGTRDGNTVQSELIAIKSATVTADYSRRNAINLALAYNKFKHNEDVTIVCVGDSMTAGFDTQSKDKVPPDNGDWAKHAPVTYPIALNYILNLFTGAGHRVINRGYSGDTARASYERWNDRPNAHVAHIMLGINDSGGGHQATFDEYIHYMEKLIQRYVDWGCGVVLHTTTPIIFNSVNHHSQYFTQAIRALANIYGCPIFESDTVVQYSIYDGVYSDNVHFNTQGYNKYGNAVGAFIMAGGWVQSPKLVKGEIHLQNGRGSEGIGYIYRSTGLHTSYGSYLNNMSTGPMKDEGNRISYTFFMDTEFMDVYGVGLFEGLNISLSYTASTQYPDDKRGEQAINRITLKSLGNRNIQETTGYLVKSGRNNQHGKYVHLGCLVGRGWKTISVYVEKDLPDVRYFNGIVLRERELTSVKQISNHDMNTGSLKPTEYESCVYQYPYFNFQESSSAVPAAVSLPETVYFPLPFALLPYSK